jgi:hypothetical protein
VRELIRHILKENRLQQELKQIIEDGEIFDAADLVGGIPTLKNIFKDDPEMSSLFGKLKGTITFYYPVIAYEDIEFPLNYEIIGRHSNIAKTNHWPEINVLYDENKLTPEENEDFKSMIKYLYDEAQHSTFKSKFEDSRLFNVNYLTVKELNGEDIDSIESGVFSLTEAEELHDKLYGGTESLNESEEKQVKYLNILKDLVEPFKDEDCVCSVKVWYNDEDDMYLIDVEVGTQEMKEKFFAEVGKTHYVKKLRLKIKETIKDYLPIDNFYVGTYATPKCGTKRWWDDSLNEGSNKEKSLIKLIKKDGLYNFIEMTGLDFNQVKSLLKHVDNPKEILKQYIREFVLEHDGMSNGDYGSLFALRLPLSNTKYVNDILVQDRDQIVVEIWGYEEDEYGHTEQTYQYLTSINVLTNEELLSIISWMMETIEGGYWD